MSAACCAPAPPSQEKPGSRAAATYRKVLWAALAINALMFVVEVAAGLDARSVSLLADSVDFLGDAANYGVSLFVLGMALKWRARAALLQGSCMAVFGLWILGVTAHNALAGALPDAPVMGAVSVLALVANAGVALMLYRHREGDSNMRSVWICSRNDAIGNVAVMLAAFGVFGTGSGWPDLAVGAIMAALALSGAFQVIRHALADLRPPAATLSAAE